MPPKGPKPNLERYDETLWRGPWVQALCIGVDAYAHLKPLNNAVADVVALAAAIQGKCFYAYTFAHTCAGPTGSCCWQQSSPYLFLHDLTAHLDVCIQIFQECHGRVGQNRCHGARIPLPKRRWSACLKHLWRPSSAHPRAL